MNKIITLLACSILIVSCNSDKEIVDGLSNRILKINTRIHSQNKGIYNLNVLVDSINIIKFDISTAKIKDENKVIVSKLLDSVSNNILQNIVGKSVKIGNIEVAQYDFPNRMEWDNVNKAFEALGNGWRLPTKEQLKVLYQNRVAIGGFADVSYWSSTEVDGDVALAWGFGYCCQFGAIKHDLYYVRAIRTL